MECNLAIEFYFFRECFFPKKEFVQESRFNFPFEDFIFLNKNNLLSIFFSWCLARQTSKSCLLISSFHFSNSGVCIHVDFYRGKKNEKRNIIPWKPQMSKWRLTSACRSGFTLCDMSSVVTETLSSDHKISAAECCCIDAVKQRIPSQRLRKTLVY